ncbi:VOC family protein [Longispora albida]|uniref:VOC family protein n=1 Tax=Longispora albida TaxID=203523 RepID=UPI00035DF2DE|nr:VOC family protein [Longispora albida]
MTPVLNAIGLVAADVEATAAFYELLGLSFADPGDPHREAVLPGGVRLMLDAESTIRSLYPGWERPSGGHRAALAFQCGSPAEVDAKVAELATAGYTVLSEPWDAFWGQRYAAVLDPDGSCVDLYAPLTAPGD